MPAWNERKYFDLWTANHFLFGMISAILLFRYGANVREAFVIAIILFVVWELIEVATKAGEAWTNQLIDIVVGMLGFLAVFYFQNLTDLPVDNLALGILLILFGLLEIWGYATRWTNKIY